MDNAAIAAQLDLLAKLMDIHGENTFRARHYASAAFAIEKLPAALRDTPRNSIAAIRGIGDSMAKKLEELLDTGKLAVLDEYLGRTPPGVIEMLRIKGIGPKKIHTIWKEMGIESIGELQYACNENRLTRYKGFGAKTQQNVLESIAFYLQSQGHFLYAELAPLIPQIQGFLEKMFTPEKVRVTGAWRRQSPVIEALEFIVLVPKESAKRVFQTAAPPELLEDSDESLLYRLKNGLKLRLYIGEAPMAEKLFETTGSSAFVTAFREQVSPSPVLQGTEPDDAMLFQKAGLPFVHPCLRESAEVLQQARSGSLPELIRPTDIRGIIHSHSNWSDGTNTLEEMAESCIQKGYEYLVISDHSQTAAYANGLRADRVRAQHRQIDALNDQLAPFRIYKSIESDILNDGSLDYPNDILDTFDLVIASIHSNLRMTEEKAMERLLRAIENPFTSILGHPTGRLLLSRNGYPVDHRRIIDACAANRVVIEINAHPRRLDLDWSWIGAALEKEVILSIDPDAHMIEGFDDVHYGVLAAQKGGLTKTHNLSSYTKAEFEDWLNVQKAKRS